MNKTGFGELLKDEVYLELSVSPYEQSFLLFECIRNMSFEEQLVFFLEMFGSEQDDAKESGEKL